MRPTSIKRRNNKRGVFFAAVGDGLDTVLHKSSRCAASPVWIRNTKKNLKSKKRGKETKAKSRIESHLKKVGLVGHGIKDHPICELKKGMRITGKEMVDMTNKVKRAAKKLQPEAQQAMDDMGRKVVSTVTGRTPKGPILKSTGAALTALALHKTQQLQDNLEKLYDKSSEHAKTTAVSLLEGIEQGAKKAKTHIKGNPKTMKGGKVNAFHIMSALSSAPRALGSLGRTETIKINRTPEEQASVDAANELRKKMKMPLIPDEYKEKRFTIGSKSFSTKKAQEAALPGAEMARLYQLYKMNPALR